MKSPLTSHRQGIIRDSAVIYIIAGIITGIAIFLPSIGPMVDRAPALALAAMTIPAAVLTRYGPWYSRHPGWYLVIQLIAVVHLTVFLRVTGGSVSPFWPLVVFIILIATSYYDDTRALTVMLVASVAVLASPALYESGWVRQSLDDFLVRGMSIAVSFLLGRRLFTGVVRGTAEIQRLESEQQAVERQRQFAQMVVHEVRRPVTAIAGYGELLESRAKLEPEERQLLDSMKRGWQAIVQLADDLSALTEVELSLVLKPEETNVADLIQKCVDEARLRTTNHDIRMQTPPEAIWARCDARRVSQVIDNLLENAIRYSPEGGPVDVRLSLLKGEVLVTVQDAGVGIPADVLHELFKPFYRAQREAIESIAGTGLGLALCKDLIEAHGGRIWAESKEGEGSQFNFTLPLASNDASLADRRQASDRPLPAW